MGVAMRGSVELVSMNGAFNRQCSECAKMIIDECEDEIACPDCFVKHGQLRIVLKKESDEFIVVVIPLSNVRSKGVHFGKINQSNNQAVYLSNLHSLQQCLKKIDTL